MRTYRIFDTHTMAQQNDILIFCPRWVARLIAVVKGPCWDYESEASYQRHYGRARL